MNKQWTAMWGNAISITTRHAGEYAKNITLRYPVYAPFSGTGLRFTFDNFTGTAPVTLSEVWVAKAVSARGIERTSSVPVTFGGMTHVTMAPGRRVTSDPINFAVDAGEKISVSIYLGEYTSMRAGVYVQGPLSGGAYALGNECCSATLPLERTLSTNWYYFLSDIDIFTDGDNHAIICYGDSITAQDWPDYLQLEARSRGITNCSIIRKAVSGTRILRQYDCIRYESYGLKGRTRFPHETAVTGADTILIQHGINDIIHPVGTQVNPFRPMSDLPTCEELIDGIRWYVQESRRLGLSVFTGTLLPICGWRTYEPFRETLKNEFNDWLRSLDGTDGCVDFEQALRDSAHPQSFAADCDSGDHLHPSAHGYALMAKAAADKLF